MYKRAARWKVLEAEDRVDTMSRYAPPKRYQQIYEPLINFIVACILPDSALYSFYTMAHCQKCDYNPR